MRARLLQSRWAIAAVLVLGLLLGLVGGTLTAADHEAEAAVKVSDRLVIPPAAFIPTDDFDYYNNGYYLNTIGNGISGECFTAPVQFPVHMPIKKVNVNKVYMWAYDNTVGRNGTLDLYRTVPKNGDEDHLATISTLDSLISPVMYQGTASGAPVFLWNNGPYLWLCLDEDIVFYGAAINYTYTP